MYGFVPIMQQNNFDSHIVIPTLSLSAVFWNHFSYGGHKVTLAWSLGHPRANVPAAPILNTW